MRNVLHKLFKMSFIFFLCCSSPADKSAKSLGQEITDKSKSTFEIDGTLYRNKKYKFRMRFIDRWEFREGDSRTTVIKSTLPTRGISISIIINEYADTKLKDLTHTSKEINDFKELLYNDFTKAGMKIYDFEALPTFLINHPSITYKFKSDVKIQSTVLTYFNKQIHCVKDGILFNISISYPEIYIENEDLIQIEDAINSFRFEDGQY
ncbi:MAG: hypothetical protein Q8R57_09170 [Bacteroidota bacterium]|nr:hypothetical protein [Bacteroidota bacterium]